MVPRTRYAEGVALGFLRFGTLGNGDRLGTRIARLAVRLGDVWVTLVRRVMCNVEYLEYLE